MANGNCAWALLVGNGHVWNDSPSTNQCMAASDDQVDADMIMWTCCDQAGQTWDFGGVPNFASGSRSNGAHVIVWTCKATPTPDQMRAGPFLDLA